MYNFNMNFVWDEAKNSTNISKHGFDFADAHLIFDGPMLVIQDTREDYGEDRFIGIGLLLGLPVVIVYVEDTENDVIRVISLRKATKNERKIYENKL